MIINLKNLKSLGVIMTNNFKKMNAQFHFVRAIFWSLIGGYVRSLYGTTAYWTYVFALGLGGLMTQFYYLWFKKKFIEKQ